MKNDLKVSIIIPVYNGEDYLKEAIDSALSQTYKNVEIIVVNDGSTDNTDSIAKSYGNKLRYYKKENGGVATALNLGIKKMTGNYFSWLSHDDLYLPNKIETQINYLKEKKLTNKNVILYSNYLMVNETSNQIGERILNTKELTEKPEYALLRNALNGITLLIPKNAFDECGNFDKELKCTQDYDMWLRMMDKYKFIHIPYVLAKSRVHINQGTNFNPRFLTEGNPLWIKMIESIPDKRRIKLEGSIYSYYYEMSHFLGDTPYIEALKYCVNKLNTLDKNKKLTIEDFLIKNQKRSSVFKIIKNLFISLKQLGFKRTIEKIKRFLMNRRLYK